MPGRGRDDEQVKRACINSKVVPELHKQTTFLYCQVGKHSGRFSITRTAEGFACPEHGGQP